MFSGGIERNTNAECDEILTLFVVITQAIFL